MDGIDPFMLAWPAWKKISLNVSAQKITILETRICCPHLHAHEIMLVCKIPSSVVELILLMQTSLYSLIACVLLLEKSLIQSILYVHF